MSFSFDTAGSSDASDVLSSEILKRSSKAFAYSSGVDWFLSHWPISFEANFALFLSILSLDHFFRPLCFVIRNLVSLRSPVMHQTRQPGQAYDDRKTCYRTLHSHFGIQQLPNRIGREKTALQYMPAPFRPRVYQNSIVYLAV